MSQFSGSVPQPKLEPKAVHAPELGATWINSAPLSMRQLRGRAVLLDFWDYTCVNCLRTLPYLKEWYRRYRDFGLTIIGVHTPEFYFAQVPELVQLAVQEHGLNYPIVLDNDYQIWQAYANRYWPSKYLIDPEGYLRFATFGEGSYGDMEIAIQTVLREAGLAPNDLPPCMEPLRPLDAPGAMALCRRPTPELYLGYRRGKIANADGLVEEEVHRYRFARAAQPELVELDGYWLSRADCLESQKNGSRLRLSFGAAEVNAVLAAGADAPVATLYVIEDGKPIPADARGEDILVNAEGLTYLRVDRPRMYSILRRNHFAEAVLQANTSDPGLQFFSFTFVGCL